MKALSIVLFAVMCIAQLVVPGKMIWDSETAMRDGFTYKFLTEPVDPNDPFRGKYITLHFTANHVHDTASWTSGEPVYVLFKQDSAGFATIDRLGRSKPEGNYLATTVSYVDGESEVYIDIPFDRFYMEESKAKPAEDAYATASRDSARVCYGLVTIGKGRAVLNDVMIDGRSVQELARP